MSTVKTVSFEEFKNVLNQRFGRVLYNEIGKNGWTSLDSVLAGNPTSKPGPHWCEASAIPRTQRLLARYDFNTLTATFFDVWNRAEGGWVPFEKA